MSSLIGTAADRWSLARAIDALGEAARQAGRPSWVWLVGILYPSVGLGFVASWDGLLSAAPQGAFFSSIHSALLAFVSGGEPQSDWTASVTTLLGWMPCIGLCFFPLYRFLAGLARIAPARAWREASADGRAPTLQSVWRAGDGLTLCAFSLWLQLALLMVGATVLIGLPTYGLAHYAMYDHDVLIHTFDDAWRVMLVGLCLSPIIVILLAYWLAISVLMQLGLHSLAHNRRGVGSALIHAWRILRHDLPATARAILVDVLLFLSIVLIWKLIHGLVGDLPGGEVATVILKLVLVGFAGVARAGYWARAYRALGGLSPDDGVPGLVQA